MRDGRARRRARGGRGAARRADAAGPLVPRRRDGAGIGPEGPVEREAKLVLPEDAELPPFDVPGTRVAEPEVLRLHTTYWDTPDRALARSGASLRYRRGVEWTAKRAGGERSGVVLDRPERAFDGDGSAPPPGAVEFLGVPGADLRPVAVLETERERRNVCAEGSDAALVEAVDDSVRVLAPDGAPAGGFREVELEVVDPAGAAVLDEILRRVRDAGVEPEEAMPKYERALGMLDA